MDDRLAVGSRLGFGSVEQVTDIVPADLTTLHLGSLGGIGSTIPGTGSTNYWCGTKPPQTQK